MFHYNLDSIFGELIRKIYKLCVNYVADSFMNNDNILIQLIMIYFKPDNLSVLKLNNMLWYLWFIIVFQM